MISFDQHAAHRGKQETCVRREVFTAEIISSKLLRQRANNVLAPIFAFGPVWLWNLEPERVFVSSHTSTRTPPHGTASLSAVVFCFRTLHTAGSTCLSLPLSLPPSLHPSIPRSQLLFCGEDEAARKVCVTRGILRLRQGWDGVVVGGGGVAVTPISGPAGPPITHTLRRRPEKAGGGGGGDDETTIQRNL